MKRKNIFPWLSHFHRLLVHSAACSGAGVERFTGSGCRIADWSRRRAAASDRVARRLRPWQRRQASPGNAVRLPRRREVVSGRGSGSPADHRQDCGRYRWTQGDVEGSGRRSGTGTGSRWSDADAGGMSRLWRHVRQSDVTHSCRLRTTPPPTVRHRFLWRHRYLYPLSQKQWRPNTNHHNYEVTCQN